MLTRFARAIRALKTDDRPPDDRGSIDWAAIYPAHRPDVIAPPAGAVRRVRSVAAATSSVVLAVANPDRSSLTIANASTATLYVALGPVAAAIAGGYTVALGAGATYVLEEPNAWRGDVAGVWSAVNGAASITETAADGR